MWIDRFSFVGGGALCAPWRMFSNAKRGHKALLYIIYFVCGVCWRYRSVPGRPSIATGAQRRKCLGRLPYKNMPVACFRQKKAPIFRSRLLCWHYLSSRAVARQVLSAQMSLTSVFGMGTGGPSLQSIPTRMDGFEPIFYINAPSGFLPLVEFGDPYRIRTDVNGVRGRCLNHLTNGPFGAPSGTRTRDPLIKSQVLYQLS